MNENSERNGFLKILKDGTSEEKNHALEKILSSKDCSLIIPMVDSIEKEKDRSVKERTLLILGNLVPLENYKSIDRLLKSPDPFVRNGAVEIIKRSNKPIVEFFRKIANDEDKDVRKFVIDSLANNISEESKDIIRLRLEDSELNIIYTAIEHLGNFKDEKSFEKIERILLSTNNFMVECSSLEALAKIGLSQKQSEIINKYSKNENAMTIFPFLKYLERFGKEENLNYVVKLIETKPKIYLKEAIDAIEGIVKRSGKKDLPAFLKSSLDKIIKSGINEINQYEIQNFMNRREGDNTVNEARKMLENDKIMIVLGGIEILADFGGEEDIEILENLTEKFEDIDEILEAVGDAVMKIDERLG